MAATARPSATHVISSTFGDVGRLLWQHKSLTALLIVVSIVLGVIPTLKSEFESGVVGAINDFFRPASGGDSVEKPASFDQALQKRITVYGLDDPKRDLTERAAGWLVHGATTRDVALTYFALVGVAYFLQLGATYLRSKLTQSVLAVFRGRAMRNALMLETVEVKDDDGPNAPGQYANAIQQGAENVANTYEFVFRVVEELFAITIAIIAIQSKSWMFAVTFLVIAIMLALISHVQHKRLEKKRRELDGKRNALLARTDDILSKREILAAYEQQARYGDKIDEATMAYATVGRSLTIADSAFKQFSESLMDAGRIFVLLTAVAVAVGGFAVSDVTDAYFIISLYVRLLVPTSNLIARYTALRRVEATAATFLDVYGRRDGKYETHKPGVATAKSGEIEFRNVTFGYKPEHMILKNCSFTIPARQVTLIVGPSGCGKSTIARLVLGFWRAEQGEVVVDGEKITATTDGHALRKLMSYVAQGDHIVDDSVRDNLTWAARADGQPASDDDMRAALQAVGLSSVNLDGAARALSIGQQQRLSVARLLLDQSPILILDEPLSGVDVFTSADLVPKLVAAMKNRTVIIISHKLSFAAFADHVIVLDANANVVEQGAIRDLVKQDDSAFARVHRAAIQELTVR